MTAFRSGSRRPGRGVFVVLVVVATSAECLPAAADGFDPRVITFGSEREQIKNLPIEKRPYRPLHVYGNSVRRRHGRSVTPGPQGSARR